MIEWYLFFKNEKMSKIEENNLEKSNWNFS